MENKPYVNTYDPETGTVQVWLEGNSDGPFKGLAFLRSIRGKPLPDGAKWAFIAKASPASAHCNLWTVEDAIETFLSRFGLEIPSLETLLYTCWETDGPPGILLIGRMILPDTEDAT